MLGVGYGFRWIVSRLEGQVKEGKEKWKGRRRENQNQTNIEGLKNDDLVNV